MKFLKGQKWRRHPPYGQIEGACVRENANDYLLMQTRIEALQEFAKKNPDMLGRPAYFAMNGDDIHIYPASDKTCRIVTHYFPPMREA